MLAQILAPLEISYSRVGIDQAIYNVICIWFDSAPKRNTSVVKLSYTGRARPNFRASWNRCKWNLFSLSYMFRIIADIDKTQYFYVKFVKVKEMAGFLYDPLRRRWFLSDDLSVNFIAFGTKQSGENNDSHLPE